MAVAYSGFVAHRAAEQGGPRQGTLGSQCRKPLGSLGQSQRSLRLLAEEPGLVPLQLPHCIPACSPAPWQLSIWEGQELARYESMSPPRLSRGQH